MRHTVVYDDGDTELLRLWDAAQQVRLVTPPGAWPAAAAALGSARRGGGEAAAQAAAAAAAAARLAAVRVLGFNFAGLWSLAMVRMHTQKKTVPLTAHNLSP